ncbi:unnamed protein product [Lymnaea stagnalis]|uniref:Uncharacterized protein n=1 Tax=Lymnaea stagnalis TaxID=6523 RepID=A0AAV2HNA8_LYMST
MDNVACCEADDDGIDINVVLPNPGVPGSKLNQIRIQLTDVNGDDHLVKKIKEQIFRKFNIKELPDKYKMLGNTSWHQAIMQDNVKITQFMEYLTSGFFTFEPI